MIDLLPRNFDTLAQSAVKEFWSTRKSAAGKGQGGTRDSVTSGKNMDGFTRLVRAVATHCGLDERDVRSDRSHVALPGYFRATKNWDVLVIHRRRLLAVFEFKSQVGSLGNNFNNRSEEVIGAAADLWVAHRHGAYGDEQLPSHGGVVADAPALLHPDIQQDPRPPFLGWMMLLEDSKSARAKVRCSEPNYPVFPEFRGASYAQRYQLLCNRLVERRLYSAAALVLSSQTTGKSSGATESLCEATSLRNLYAEFAAKVLAARDSTENSK